MSRCSSDRLALSQMFFRAFSCPKCGGKATEVDNVVHAIHLPWCPYIASKLRLLERGKHKCQTSPCDLSARLADFPA